MKNNLFGMSATQVTILASIFGVWMIVMFAFFTVVIYTNSQSANPQPTQALQGASVTPQKFSTSTPVPPPTRRPTWTPEHTPTKIPTLTSIAYATKPGSVMVAVPTSAEAVAQYDCNSAQILKNKELHRVNLININNFYNKWISYYNSVIDRAAANRDALALDTAQKALSKLKKNYKSDIATENTNYALAVPAACR